jgi:hypothetical protein
VVHDDGGNPGRYRRAHDPGTCPCGPLTPVEETDPMNRPSRPNLRRIPLDQFEQASYEDPEPIQAYPSPISIFWVAFAIGGLAFVGLFWAVGWL